MNAPTVTLHVRRRAQAQADPFGETAVGDWGEPEDVGGCLFAPGTPEGIDSDRPNGARIEATAFFPVGYAGSLRGARVSVDGTNWLYVVGDPQRFPKLPDGARWDLYVLLTATEG